MDAPEPLEVSCTPSKNESLGKPAIGTAIAREWQPQGAASNTEHLYITFQIQTICPSQRDDLQ